MVAGLELELRTGPGMELRVELRTGPGLELGMELRAGPELGKRLGPGRKPGRRGS